MRVFISYSTAADQIVALRLQTMASVYGITVYVPPATSRTTSIPELTPEVSGQLRQSDVVLAVITQNPSLSVNTEMQLALAWGKLLIPIIAPHVTHNFQMPHFVVDPLNPSLAEQQIVQFLAQKQQTETTNKALLALTTLALALILLGSSGSK